MLERLVGHDRAEIGTANADVDDTVDGLPGVSQPLAVSHPLRKDSHLVKNRVHLRHDIDAVDHNLLAPRRPQGDMKNCAAFRDVDLPAFKHGFDALTEVALTGEIHEQPYRLIGDTVLRVV